MPQLRGTLDFLLYQWLDAAALTAQPRYAEHSRETFDAVLEVAERLARERFAPFNRLVDSEEPRFDGERVQLPAATREAVAAYLDAGLLASGHDYEQGGMHYVGFAELAAAVSNAGGLGIITGLTQKTPELLANEIAKCRAMTDKAFGVNLTFLPTVSSPDYPGYIRAIIDGGVKAVETAGNNPQKWLPMLHEAGVKVIHKCTSVRHALKAQAIGCDAVSVDGFECGGHPGEDDIPNFILLPRAADELKVPFVASGGMADGRSLVAALALGADGINMGTRFIATQEAPVHQNVKDAIVAASELDTRLVMRPLRNTERVLRNAAVDRLIEKEKALGDGIRFEDIIDEVAGVYPRIMLDGAMDAGAWSCGMVAGLIHDIPTVKELIDRIMAEAEAIIGQRLSRLAAVD